MILREGSEDDDDEHLLGTVQVASAFLSALHEEVQNDTSGIQMQEGSPCETITTLFFKISGKFST